MLSVLWPFICSQDGEGRQGCLSHDIIPHLLAPLNLTLANQVGIPAHPKTQAKKEGHAPRRAPSPRAEESAGSMTPTGWLFVFGAVLWAIQTVGDWANVKSTRPERDTLFDLVVQVWGEFDPPPFQILLNPPLTQSKIWAWVRSARQIHVVLSENKAIQSVL